MISRTILLLFLTFTSPIFGQQLKPLFDGKTFKGWEQRGEAIWEINDGVITGRTGKGGHGWLCTDRTYSDFILELEVKISAGNGGIQVRSHFEEGDKMVGYQVEVDPSPRAWSGGLYEQGRRGWLQNLTNNPAARAAFKTNDWNRYRIEVRGDSFRTWVNDVPATDYRDSLDIEGIIALQVHSGKNHFVQFRNIRIADLGNRKWEPLWNGENFKGWQKSGAGEWRIENGVIIGKNAKNEPGYGHLFSQKRYDDFTIRLKYKAVAGNSGLYFRTVKSESGLQGIQAEIDATNDAGGLYESGGRGWVVQPDPKDVKKWFRPNEWNTMTVSAHGSRIAVDVNGFRTAEVINDPSRRDGYFALQLHGGQDVEVHFKDIEILSGPDPKFAKVKPEQSVQIIEQSDRLRIELGGVLFTEYKIRDVPRPFFYPVLGPGQVGMTRNWSMREASNEDRDHPHQKGLTFTHGAMNGVDFWTE
ncbi:MAG: family 16 glycoside hydrolase, partial [Limisphaerales bacterium]